MIDQVPNPLAEEALVDEADRGNTPLKSYFSGLGHCFDFWIWAKQ